MHMFIYMYESTHTDTDTQGLGNPVICSFITCEISGPMGGMSSEFVNTLSCLAGTHHHHFLLLDSMLLVDSDMCGQTLVPKIFLMCPESLLVCHSITYSI